MLVLRKVTLRFRKIWMDQSCYATVSIMGVLSFLSWYHFHCVFQCGMCVFTRGQVGLGNAKPLCQYALMPGIYLYQCGQTKEDTRTSFTRRGPRPLVLYIFHFGDFICTKMSRSQNHHAQDNFSLNAKLLPILMQIASGGNWWPFEPWDKHYSRLGLIKIILSLEYIWLRDKTQPIHKTSGVALCNSM